MLGLTHVPARAGHPRGDGPHTAAWELKQLERAHRWHARSKVLVYVLAGLLVVLFGSALVAGIAAGDPIGAMGGIFSAVLGGMLLRYTVLSRGTAVTVLSLLAAAAMGVELSLRFDAGWLSVVTITVSAAATVWATMTRVTVLPRAVAAAIGQWIPVAAALLTPVVGAAGAALIGAVLTAVAMFLVANGAKWISARRTASAQGWELRMPGLELGPPVSGDAPPDVTSGRWRHIIEAQEQTASELGGLDDRWVVLHSRLVPNIGGLVDHVAVGPPGVVLIDTRFQRGDLAARDVAEEAVTFEALLDGASPVRAASVPGRDAPEVLAQDVVPAAVTVEKIAGSGQTIPVIAVVATQGGRTQDVGATASVDHDDALRTVHIAAGPYLSSYVSSLPAVLTDEQVAAAARIVDYVMPRGY